MKYIFSVILLALAVSPSFAQGRGQERERYERNRRPEVQVEVQRQRQRPRFEIRVGIGNDYNRGIRNRGYQDGFNAGRNDSYGYRRYDPYRAIQRYGWNNSPVYRNAFFSGYANGFRRY
jgi:hypothetical protein